MRRNQGLKLMSLLATVFCGCVDSGQALKVEGISKAYGVKDAVVFRIQNLSKTKVFYQVGVQTHVDGSWRETVPDINRKDYLKRVLLENVIGPNEVKELKWPVQADSLYKPSVGKHRFVVFYVSDLNDTYLNLLTPEAVHEKFQSKKTYSGEFEVMASIP